MVEAISDPVERRIAAVLDRVGIGYKRNVPIGGRSLDFFIPDWNTYIECKQFHSNRSNAQLACAENVILVQGMGAVALLEACLGRDPYSCR